MRFEAPSPKDKKDEVNNFAKKAFGPPGSKIRHIWYWLLLPASFALAQAVQFEEHRFIAFISCLIVDYALVLLFIFVNFPALKIISAWRYLIKLKKQLDPIAFAISGEISSRCDFESGNFYHYYNFPDGNWITLVVWAGNFNVHSPNWNPGYEKKTEGIEVLWRAIAQAHDSGIAY